MNKVISNTNAYVLNKGKYNVMDKKSSSQKNLTCDKRKVTLSVGFKTILLTDPSEESG